MSATAEAQGGALAISQDLGQEGPQDDLGGEDVVLAEQAVLVAEGLLDIACGQHLREGQARLLQERLEDGLEGMLV